MGDISINFSYSEFEESAEAKARKIDNRIPNEQVRKSIALLVAMILQPLRNRWGKSLTVNSGYRCKALNAAVGGVATSQHCKGEAADIKATVPYELAKVAYDLHLPYDQMILYPTFVHFSYKANGIQRRQVLYSKNYKGKRI